MYVPLYTRHFAEQTSRNGDIVPRNMSQTRIISAQMECPLFQLVVIEETVFVAHTANRSSPSAMDEKYPLVAVLVEPTMESVKSKHLNQ